MTVNLNKKRARESSLTLLVLLACFLECGSFAAVCMLSHPLDCTMLFRIRDSWNNLESETS